MKKLTHDGRAVLLCSLRPCSRGKYEKPEHGNGNGSLLPACSLSRGKYRRTNTIGPSFADKENERFFPRVSPNWQKNRKCPMMSDIKPTLKCEHSHKVHCENYKQMDTCKREVYWQKNRRCPMMSYIEPTLKCEHSHKVHCENYKQMDTCKREVWKIGNQVFHTSHAKGERWIDRKIKRCDKTRKAWESLHIELAFRLKEASQKLKTDERRYMAEVGFFHGAFTRLLKLGGEFPN
uniref:Uncharacterized protein n=1 Tax=Lobelia erinus TaxID=16430 RepID=A0A291F6B9_LOBER|nr:hypothetical protein Lo_eri1Pt0116 [Lobelia erinus]ATG27653.1 hypothetical protein Lo_eri1Pt0116 [Lobelia erinus]